MNNFTPTFLNTKSKLTFKWVFAVLTLFFLSTQASFGQNLTQSGFTGIMVPQYMSSGTSTRLPVMFRATVSGLTPSTSYRYYVQGATNSTAGGGTVDIGTASTGAGASIFVNGSTYTTSASQGLTTAGTYDTFTTDASGSYTGWFGFVCTGNARFTAGNIIYPSIAINAGGTGTTVNKRLALDTTITVLAFSASAGATNGSFLNGTSSGTAKNLVALYDNVEGNGRPYALTVLEAIGVTNTTTGLTTYGTSAGNWGTIIPNSITNGIRRIEQYSVTTGAAVNDNQDADGTWTTGSINTSTSTNNTTAKTISSTDAPLNVATTVALSSPNPAVTAGNVTVNSTNNPIYRFDLAPTLAISTLTGVTVTTAGSYTTSDIQNLKCWYSTSSTFNSGTATLLSTIAAPTIAGSQAFPSFTRQVLGISGSPTYYIFITADVKPGAANGNTISVSAITTSNISFTSKNSFTGTANAGGVQTIGPSGFTVTFNSNGGSAVSSITGITSGNTVTLPTAPTKSNLTFAGWFSDNGTFSTAFTSSTAVTADITVYAKWTATVTFNSNGGTAVTAISGITAGNTITLPTAPTKSNLTFAGWFSDNGTFATAFTAATAVPINITVYAKWTATVTFNSNGGSAVSTISGITAGATITLPTAPTKTGLSFGGWFSDNTTFATAFTGSTAVNTDITVYAKWTATVTFNSNGGTAVTAISGVTEGSTITLPTAPTKASNTFAGWFTDDVTFANAFDGTTVVLANITVYAKWTLNSNYTVTFNSNGGSTVSPITGVTSGSTVTLPTAPTKSNLTFAGWYSDNGTFATVFDATTAVTGDITVYAKWTATVTFNSNGGSAVSAISGITAGATITLPSAPTKSNLTFGGWYSDNGTFAIAFTAATAVNTDITVYAKWTSTVTFNSNGGSAVSAISGITAGATITLPTAPTKANLTFAGWFSDDVTFATAFTAATAVNTDITVYAKWTATVTFNSNGGSAVSAITGITPGNTITLPTAPTKTNLTFAGWFSDNTTFTTAFTGSTAVNTNITVYAKWTATVTFNSNGGSAVSAISGITAGGTITLPTAPTKANLTFAGWFSDNTTFLTAFTGSTAVNTDITVYAKWTATVTFNSNGGSAVTAISGITAGNTITLPTAPTKSGSSFGGWFSDDVTFATAFTASTAVPVNITVYAKWNPFYSVTYDANGGTGSQTDASSYAASATVTVLGAGTVARTNYVFVGWNTQADGAGTDRAAASTFSMPSNNVTLYAKWANIIISENMGTTTGTASTYTGWQNNSTFTYTSAGTTSIATTNASTGYTGASGSSNVFLTTTSGNSIEFSGIDTETFNNLSLSFGIFKSTTASTGSDIVLEYSTDGTTYTPLSFTALPSGTGTAIWALRTVSTGIPSVENLRIRFRQNGTATQYRIDDVVLTGVRIPEPEIAIKGGSPAVLIVDGDTTPATADSTDFGNVTAPGTASITKTFTIQSKGPLALNLTGTPKVSISGTYATDFTVSAVPSSPLAAGTANVTATYTTITPTTTTFDITFDPSAAGLRTATLSITTNDTDEATYNFDIQGTGTNSTSSDIIADGTYTPPTDILYKNFNATSASITAGTSQDVFRFIVRDGGASTPDGDTTGTILSAITFNVSSGFNNILGAGLFTTGGTKINTSDPVISGSTIVFNSLPAGSFTAADNGSLTVVLRLSFQNTNALITDRQDIRLAVSAASAVATGSVFAAADAGAAASSTTAGDNKIQVVADRLGFTTQPPGYKGVNAAMASVVVAATDSNGVTDKDFNTAITITSSGTLSASPVSATTFANGVASFTNSIIHTVTGGSITPFKLTATTSASLASSNTVLSTGFEIGTIDYPNNAYRSLTAGTWNSSGTGSASWEKFNSTTGQWTGSADPNTSGDVCYINTNIDVPLAGGSYATPTVFVMSGKTLTYAGNGNWTMNLTVMDGGTFIDSYSTLAIAPGGTFKIENNGTFIFNVDTAAASTFTSSLWAGAEDFMPNSNFIIRTCDTGSGKNFLPAPANLTARTYVNLAGNTNTAYFGNLIIDNNNTTFGAGKTGTWRLCSDTYSTTLTHQDLIFRTLVSSMILTDTATTLTVGRDLVFESGYSNTLTGTTSTVNVTLNVKGSVKNSSDNTNGFTVSNNVSSTFTFAIDGNLTYDGSGAGTLNLSGNTGTTNVNLKGNLSIASSSIITSTTTNGTINFTNDYSANSIIQTLSTASASTSTNSNVKFVVPNKSYVKLANQNLALSASGGVSVSSGGILDFGFNGAGTSALQITKVGLTPSTTFVLSNGGTLKITSPDGITSTSGADAANGNVLTDTRTYGAAGSTFHYIPSASVSSGNQVTGTGLPAAGTTETILCDLPSNSNTLTLTSSSTMTTGTLNINKGKFIETTTATISLSSGTAGTLIMGAGTYYKIPSTSASGTDVIPRLIGASNAYTLGAGSTIELSGAGDQVLRGARDYVNLVFSNSNTATTTTKTISFAVPNVSETITIKDNNTIVNVGSNTFGGTGTGLTMTDNSRLIVSGARTVPDMLGTYSLTGGTIEFAGNSNNHILRAPLTAGAAYNNIVVSGLNVNGGAGNCLLKAGASFTIDAGKRYSVTNQEIKAAGATVNVNVNGTFATGDQHGFSGNANTSVNLSNIVITLGAASVIEYNADGIGTSNAVQTVSSRSDYKNVTINNTTPIAVGLNTDGDVTLSGTLALTSGVVDTGIYKINVGSGSVTRGSGWVKGNLQKYISASGAKTFEVGDSSYYTPASLNVSGTGFTAGDLLVSTAAPLSATAGYATLNLDKATGVNRAWSVTIPGGSTFAGSYAGTFTFNNPGDVLGSPSYSALRTAVYNGSTWAYPGTVTSATSTSVSAPSITPAATSTIAFLAAKTPTISVSGTQLFTYDGTPQGPATVSNDSDATPTLLYTNQVGTAAYSSATAPTNAGDYQVVASVVATANYSAASSAAYTFTIAKATLIPSLTATVISRAYNGTNVTASLTYPTNFSLSGIIGTDAVTIASTTGTYDDKFVGINKTVTVTGLTLAGAKAANYQLSTTSVNAAIGTITGKVLTVAVVSNPSIDKIYDATNAASIVQSNFNVTGIVGTEDVSITYTGSVYNTRNITANQVTVSGLGLTGGDAGNYSLATTTVTGTNVGTISQRDLVATLVGPVNKQYDGTNAATLSAASYTLDAVQGIDIGTITVTNTTGSYNSPSIAAGKTVTVTGLTLGGAQAANYNLTNTSVSAAVGEITGKSLTVSLVGPIAKIYDGNTTATVGQSNFTFSAGVVSGEDVYVSNTVGAYNSKTVGTKNVTVTGLTLGGADSGNYVISNAISVTGVAQGSITQKNLTISGASSQDRPYDGTTDALVSGGSLVGVASGDTVNLVQAGTLPSKDFGGPYVVIPNFSITGLDSPNYTLSQTSLADASITKKVLTVSGANTADKIYDGNNGATISGGTLLGVVGTEDVNLSFAATYSTNQVGGPYVITPNASISGAADLNNYSLTQPTLNQRSILGKPLTVTGVTASDKVYDGLTTATINTASAVLNGVVGSESVTLNTSSTANFVDKNVGTAKLVTASGFTISGAAAINYTLAQPTATADITAKALAITASDQNLCSGSTFSPAGTEFTRDFVVTGDVTSVTLTKTGAGVTDGLGRTTYTIVPSAAQGPGVGNYTISYANGTLTVNPTPTAAITVNNATACVNDSTPLVTFTGANGTAGYKFGYKINGGTTLFASSATNIATVAVTTGTPRTDVYTLVSVQDLSTGCSQAQSGTVSVTIGACTALSPQFRGTTLSDLNNTLSSITVAGATTYRYEITNLTTNAVSVFDRSDVNKTLFSLVQFQTSPASPTQVITYNTTYSVRVAVDNGSFIYGPAYTVKTPVQVPSCKLAIKYCGATISAINEPVYANTVYNATKYKFRVNGPGITNEEIVLNGAGLNLTQLTQNIILYGTPYTVEVKASVDGGATYPTAYGIVCTVTTPFTAPTSRIDPKTCGKTVSMASAIYPLAVYGADAYYFEVSGGNLATPVGYEVTNMSAPAFRFNQITGATTNQTYSVRVSVRFNGVYPTTNGIDKLFGTSCTINTGATRMSETDLSSMNVFNVSAFPNPFARHFSVQIESSSDELVEMKVYDMIGRELEAHKATVSELSTREIGNNYPSGVYNIVVSQGDKVKSLRMIKR